MKNFLSLLVAVLAVFMAASCTSNSKQQDSAADDSAPKALVLYYSQTGATKAVAEELQKALNADIEAIEVEEPYDGTYDETIQRCIAEREQSVVPKIKPIKADLGEYDVIFLGYPIWFGTYARPICSLVEAYDFDGMTIVPFCTFGSGGLEASASDLKEALPKAEIFEGYGVRNARLDAVPYEVEYFLVSNGFIDGDVEPLPAYSAQEPVTDDDVAVFDAACGNYMFPLGTPVTCGKRATASATDYMFIADSKDAQGDDTQSIVYVTVAEGSDPVFTKVVR